MDAKPDRRTGARPADRDRVVLEFAAEHRLVLERQVERLLGIDHGPARTRLRKLVAEHYLRSDSMLGDDLFQIRPRGLAAIGSALPPPQLKLGSYRHDVGLAWLWLGARGGAFGRLREVFSERRLRSHDGALERCEQPYGVRLGGHDRYGNERLHYPDLLLVDPYGRKLALELELTGKGRQRREAILGGYAADTRIDRVLYVLEANSAGRGIERALIETARELGISDRVGVQRVRPFSAHANGPERVSRRAPPIPKPAEAAR